MKLVKKNEFIAVANILYRYLTDLIYILSKENILVSFCILIFSLWRRKKK